MVIELEFDYKVEVRFFVARLPEELLLALGDQRQALYEATARPRRYGAQGQCDVEAAGKHFLVFVRLGAPFVGDGGDTVQPVRVLHIIENTLAD